jgi:hypothetical protein
MGLTKQQVISKMSVAEAQAALEQAIERNRKATEKRNREFNKLPDARKRVVIAEDVLQQMKAKRFIAKLGTYIGVPYSVKEKFESSGEGEGEPAPLHEVLEGVQCEVCGIGSLFVAAVDRMNECSVSDIDAVDDDRFMREYLGGFFEEDQLVLIEAAFEGRFIRRGSTGYAEWSSEVTDAIRFGNSAGEDAAKRLRKIMKNIVDNKGTFVP